MGTLKTTDLPVGSWVRHEGREGFVASISISAPDYSPLVMLMDQGYLFWGNVPIESLEPIPITPKILETNGWRESPRGEFYHYLRLDKNRTLYVHASLNGWCMEIIYDAAGILRTTHFIPDIVSVHQLQQALRLAGVDKEIVMPNM